MPTRNINRTWEMKYWRVIILFSTDAMRTGAMNKVVILAGGRGSRLGGLSEASPKPLVKVGGIPIIDHIMSLFRRYVPECEFLVAGGYRCDLLYEHFDGQLDVNVTYTGKDAGSAGRLLHLVEHLTEPFYMCYGDGLTDFPLHLLSQRSDCITNMLTVHPIGRFGEVEFDVRHIVRGFSEKPQLSRWINGGFFYCRPDLVDFIHFESDDLASDVLPRLVPVGQLACVPYDGYWHCMDTPRDVEELNFQIESGDAKWLK